jgi:hypothetical protein
MDFVETADYEPQNQDLPENDPSRRQAFKGLKVRRGDITSPDFLQLAISFGLTTQDAIFEIWNPTDFDFDPRPSDTLKLDDQTRWVFVSSVASRFGRWLVPCKPAKENTPL